jgi:hypothetical protein
VDAVNPRSAIRQAATKRSSADTELVQAVADAYGILPIGEIAAAAQAALVAAGEWDDSEVYGESDDIDTDEA